VSDFGQLRPFYIDPVHSAVSMLRVCTNSLQTFIAEWLNAFQYVEMAFG